MSGLLPGRRNIAVVFQSYAVFRQMTVGENIAFGHRMTKRPEAGVREPVERAGGRDFTWTAAVTLEGPSGPPGR